MDEATKVIGRYADLDSKNRILMESGSEGFRALPNMISNWDGLACLLGNQHVGLSPSF